MNDRKSETFTTSQRQAETLGYPPKATELADETTEPTATERAAEYLRGES